MTVRCEGDTDWNKLVTDRSLAVRNLGGYAPLGGYMTWLSPTVCLYLQKFAQAAVKPTKCQATASETVSVTRQRVVTRYRSVKVTKPTRINGRLYKVGTWKIPYKATESYTVAESHYVLATPAPCFLGIPYTSSGLCWTVPTVSGTPEKSCYEVTADLPARYWSEYSEYVSALNIVAHEPTHLWQASTVSNALVESQATCSSMQWLPYVAVQLGATPDDAQAIATYYWKIKYPGYLSLTSDYAKSHPYWSADCKPGGALDIRRDKGGFWP